MTQSWFDTIPAASIQAILFDMDGTLIDSEVVGARVITDWLNEMGLDPKRVNIDEMEGVTWDNIAATIHSQFPAIEHNNLARELAVRFDRYQSTWPAPEIPGAIQTVRRASMFLKTALVTSSVRSTANLLVERFTLGDVMDAVVSVEDVKTPKPNPAPYLLAASRLGVDPQRCIVFEDSMPGLQSARSAGMTVIGISEACSESSLAHHTIADYFEIPEGFLERIAQT